MKCRNCGYEILSGELYCKRCGEEVRIVPDYNPLDDVLAEQIKVSINEKNNSFNTNRMNTQKRNLDEREARRRQAEKRREIKRKKRRRLLIAMSSILVIFIAIVIVIYLNSYSAVVRKGNKALLSSEYAVAQECFEKAIEKNLEHPDAYIGLAQVYIAKDDLNQAEKVFLDAISKDPDNKAIYDAFVKFYMDTNQALEIPKLLSKADKKVQKALEEYIVGQPEFSLDEKNVYDDVQQLTLTSKEKIIYYTTDGTEPTLSSSIYSKPIQLDEGETTVKAMCVNEKGVPGTYIEKVYVIELPIEDAPAVSPSTGQYSESMKIEIKVPEGYTAYYTTDGSTPTTASKKYVGPINMPESDTLFKAILVNGNGRASGVTTRNYILEIEDSEE